MDDIVLQRLVILVLIAITIDVLTSIGKEKR